MDLVITLQHMPRQGETLEGETIHYLPGGKGANQAVGYAKLGVSYLEDGALLTIAAPAVAVVDTTGAGDCFNAALSYGIASSWSWEKTISFALVNIEIQEAWVRYSTGLMPQYAFKNLSILTSYSAKLRIIYSTFAASAREL